ncbi:hypothetical protein MiSe_01790 [Microseira wollei NIES-4236]|uniref:Uncharacterized protein n=1 Tax=Microseira wollei NIES-4236 TaxID=2530354 RepID=A0AAV3X5G6_9CYAN|nr:hypothetical protein MiSe_01790 [Microseira wollei NIES-4236]
MIWDNFSFLCCEKNIRVGFAPILVRSRLLLLGQSVAQKVNIQTGDAIAESKRLLAKSGRTLGKRIALFHLFCMTISER